MEVSNTFKPRCVSFKLYDKKDRNLQEVLMDYKAPIPPKKPVTKKEIKSELIDDNTNEDEILEGDAAQEANLRYKKKLEIYKKNCIKSKNNPTKKIVPGIPVLTYVKCFNGCDGFGNLKLISECCQRTLPDHGLGYDMSISEI